LVGVFTIPIGDILFEKQEKFRKEMEALDKIIKNLDEMIQDKGVQSYSIKAAIDTS
jgi:chorismate-pyruvate lyase